MNVVDPATSVTNLVYRALSALVTIATSDLRTSSLSFLSVYLACYSDPYDQVCVCVCVLLSFTTIRTWALLSL